ncbi:MAG TPA: hypothetical protein VIM11_27595 [Tepidisphaeraceae bacterium]|jgi:hypothetical protein
MNRGDAYKLLADELAKCRLLGHASLAQRIGEPAAIRQTLCGGEQITIETRVLWADSKHRLIRINAIAFGPNCFRLERLEEVLIVAPAE